MGNYSYIRDRYRKRKDYDISEIEKKYTDQELSKLILVNYVQNYPTLKYSNRKSKNLFYDIFQKEYAVIVIKIK